MTFLPTSDLRFSGPSMIVLFCFRKCHPGQKSIWVGRLPRITPRHGKVSFSFTKSTLSLKSITRAFFTFFSDATSATSASPRAVCWRRGSGDGDTLSNILLIAGGVFGEGGQGRGQGGAFWDEDHKPKQSTVIIITRCPWWLLGPPPCRATLLVNCTVSPLAVLQLILGS